LGAEPVQSIDRKSLDAPGYLWAFLFSTDAMTRLAGDPTGESAFTLRPCFT